VARRTENFPEANEKYLKDPPTTIDAKNGEEEEGGLKILSIRPKCLIYKASHLVYKLTLNIITNLDKILFQFHFELFLAR